MYLRDWSSCFQLGQDWGLLSATSHNLFVTAGRRMRMHLVIKRLHERLGLGFDVLRKKEKCTVIRSPWEDKPALNTGNLLGLC